MKSTKSFVIAKREVWKAYQQVKANRGAAGITDLSWWRPSERILVLLIAERFMRTLYAPGLMQSDLSRDLDRQVKESGKHQEEVVRMFGIVFARPELEFVKREILPQLDYFNQRAGKTITFYFAGYLDKPIRRSTVTVVDGQRWSFDTKAFDEVRKYVEDKSVWKYSGGTDLILANARYIMVDTEYGNLRSVQIDFSSAISVELKKMLSKKAIDSVGSYFEEIFRYAERQDGLDPTWGFSDSRGIGAVISALKALALSLLPKPLRPEVERAAFSAVRDLNRRAAARA